MPADRNAAMRSIVPLADRPGLRLSGTAPFGRLDRVAVAILEALAYADVFGWPLTGGEVHTFLPVAAPSGDVQTALDSLRVTGWVRSTDGLFVLTGRENLIDERRRRAAISARLWPCAIRCARRLSGLPWIRLVAVSGSLAVGAAGDDADIDLFIVTDDGRLWLARALTIGLARLVRRRPAPSEVRLCPNHLVARSALALADRDMFTAHELAQLVPLFGPDAYHALLDQNAWYREFLPNHPGYLASIPQLGGRRVRRLVEPLLRNRVVGRVEAWEMHRKIVRLSAAGSTGEVRLDQSMCKGHFEGHRGRTINAFGATMSRLEGEQP